MIAFQDLPVVDTLDALLMKLQRFPDQTIRKTIDASEVRELEKAIGLIDAIVFEPVEDEEAPRGETSEVPH